MIEIGLNVFLKYDDSREKLNQDEYNLKLLTALNGGVCVIMNDGIHRITVGGSEYLIYYKHDRIISAVNTNDLDEYCQDNYTISPYLNVLFKELGSDKKLKIGLDSLYIQENDLYHLSDCIEDYGYDYTPLIDLNVEMLKCCEKIKKESK